ncbi:MAG: sensor histidine kinase [Proteobacteria bacterium]|nr:sensor histidine kinase [Pseudomonadota bacterium]
MFTRSLRWQLQAWHGLLLLVVLVTFGCTAYFLVQDNRLHRIDRELQFRALPLAGGLGRTHRAGGWDKPPEFFRAAVPDEAPRHTGGPEFLLDFEKKLFSGRFRSPPDMPSPFEELAANGYFFVAWAQGGQELGRSTNAPPDVTPPVLGEAADSTLLRTRGAFREFSVRTRTGSLLLVGHDITPDVLEFHRLRWLLTFSGAGVLGLGLVGGWWLTSRAIRPIENISQTAVKIAGGNLAERIPVTRLESAFVQQKQFTADAAHELRTPLAVLISEAQTTLARERSPGEYRETVQECLVVAQQMRRLTESLLDLSRFDSGHEALERKPVDLAAVAKDSLALVRPLAGQRRIKLFNEAGPAPCLGDAQRLGQVVTNLLTNAITYNRAGGEVRLHTVTTKDAVLMEVSDTGQGIAAEDLPHLFERFYRADKARDLGEGHTGLGLAICKAIVDAHGGTMTVTSTPGQGSTFTVRLPTVQAGDCAAAGLPNPPLSR